MRLTWLAAGGGWTLSWLCIRQYGKGLLGSLARSARRVCRPLIALLLLACSGAAYAAQPFFDNSNPDLTASRLFELEYAEGVTCSSAPAQVFPDTARWHGGGPSRLSVPEHLRPGVDGLLRCGPGVRHHFCPCQWGGDLPRPHRLRGVQHGSVGDRPPGGRAVELVLEYGGFPQESMPTMQGSKELSGEYLCLENAALSPRLMNVMPGEDGYPATIEITLPVAMTVIPFGKSCYCGKAGCLEPYCSSTVLSDLAAGDLICFPPAAQRGPRGKKRLGGIFIYLIHSRQQHQYAVGLPCHFRRQRRRLSGGIHGAAARAGAGPKFFFRRRGLSYVLSIHGGAYRRRRGASLYRRVHPHDLTAPAASGRRRASVFSPGGGHGTPYPFL